MGMLIVPIFLFPKFRIFLRLLKIFIAYFLFLSFIYKNW